MARLFKLTLFACLIYQGSVAVGQSVYVTEGPNGPTFSNVPQPGSKEVNLRPLTVIQAPKAPPPTRRPPSSLSPSKPAEETIYQDFSVTWPQDRGSVIINPGTFDVRVAVDPELRLEEGHAFSVSINGEPVRERFTATEFMIPPEFFGDAIPINQFASLEASIVDRNGVVLKKAPPVRFMMRFTTVLQNPNRSSPSNRSVYPGPVYPGITPPTLQGGIVAPQENRHPARHPHRPPPSESRAAPRQAAQPKQTDGLRP